MHEQALTILHTKPTSLDIASTVVLALARCEQRQMERVRLAILVQLDANRLTAHAAAATTAASLATATRYAPTPTPTPARVAAIMAPAPVTPVAATDAETQSPGDDVGMPPLWPVSGSGVPRATAAAVSPPETLESQYAGFAESLHALTQAGADGVTDSRLSELAARETARLTGVMRRLDAALNDEAATEELWFAALAAHHIADDLLLPGTPGPLHQPTDLVAARDSQMVLAAELALCMGSHAMLKPIMALALAVRAAAVTITPSTSGSIDFAARLFVRVLDCAVEPSSSTRLPSSRTAHADHEHTTFFRMLAVMLRTPAADPTQRAALAVMAAAAERGPAWPVAIHRMVLDDLCPRAYQVLHPSASPCL